MSIMKTIGNSLYCLFLIGLLACSSDLEVQPDEVFIKYFGTPTQQTAYDVRLNENGEFIIFGTRRSSNESANDFYIIKADAQGNLINDRVWGLDNSDDIASRVKVMEGGGYLIIGSVAQLDETLVPQQKSLYWAHLDENFETIRVDTLDANSKDLIGIDITLTMSDSIVVVGHTDSLESNEGGQSVSRQLFVAKSSLDGNVGWRKTFGFSGSDNNEEAVAIFEKPNGDLILFGSTTQSGIDGEGGVNALIFQINSLGTSPVGQVPKYGTRFGGGNADDVPATVIEIPGGYAVAGTSTLGTESYPFLLTVDNNAQLISIDTVHTPFRGAGARGIGITKALNQDFILVGQILNMVDTVQNVSKNHEMMFLRSDQLGMNKSQYASHYGLIAGNDEAAAAITMEDGSIIVAGTADFGSGVSMITLIKMNDEGLIKD